MDQYLSPKQVAEALGTSESSVKRWCDQGLLASVKTAGGHRRILVQEAVRFAREQKHEVVEPRILALPPAEDRKIRRIEGGAQRMTEALLASNEVACKSIVYDLFLAGHSVATIFDEVIAPAFRTIGKMWECREAEVYQERCSCEIATRVLHDLRRKLPPPEAGLTALGATTEGDPYSLPVAMSELVLRAVGWNARLLGCSIPFDSMASAIRTLRPKLFWVSVSTIPSDTQFQSGMALLDAASREVGTTIVIGGRGLTNELTQQLKSVELCESMRELEEFALTRLPAPRSAGCTPA